MKKIIKEDHFKASGQGTIVTPDLGKDESGDEAKSQDNSWSLDPKYTIFPPKKRRFKGGGDQEEIIAPDLDGTEGKKKGGLQQIDKNVPYPDLPDIKLCNPKGLRYARRCPDDAVEQGCGGQNVQDIQVQLIRKGFDLPRWKADCKFGDETKSAVEQFQISKGLRNNGIVDKKTHDQLFLGATAPQQSSQPAAQPSSQPSRRMFSAGGTGGIIAPNLNESQNLNVFKNIDNLNNRYEKIEKLVFERLVKKCK